MYTKSHKKNLVAIFAINLRNHKFKCCSEWSIIILRWKISCGKFRCSVKEDFWSYWGTGWYTLRKNRGFFSKIETMRYWREPDDTKVVYKWTTTEKKNVFSCWFLEIAYYKCYNSKEKKFIIDQSQFIRQLKQQQQRQQSVQFWKVYYDWVKLICMLYF